VKTGMPARSGRERQLTRTRGLDKSCQPNRSYAAPYTTLPLREGSGRGAWSLASPANAHLFSSRANARARARAPTRPEEYT
jgi:hypothetical protein